MSVGVIQIKTYLGDFYNIFPCLYVLRRRTFINYLFVLYAHIQ